MITERIENQERIITPFFPVRIRTEKKRKSKYTDFDTNEFLVLICNECEEPLMEDVTDIHSNSFTCVCNNNIIVLPTENENIIDISQSNMPDDKKKQEKIIVNNLAYIFFNSEYHTLTEKKQRSILKVVECIL